MSKIQKRLLSLLVLSLILTGITACSGKNAECKVTLDRDGNLDIIVNPPGESGEAEQHGGLTRKMEISASGGSTRSVTTYEGEIEKIYSESGHTYNINVFIKTANDRLLEYKLEVSGGVYGDTPHICEK
jgi:hypothetical protein